MKPTLDPKSTALVLVDTQNDFFHADGALRRGNPQRVVGRSFVEGLIRLCDLCRQSGCLLIGTSFTVIADSQNDALVPSFLRDLGIAVVRGDFQVSKWGHQLIEEVKPVNYVVDKVGPSAFFRTELDLILRHHEVSTVLVAGLNARLSVISTAYDALSRGFHPVIVPDGSSDFAFEAFSQLTQSLEGVFDIRDTRAVAEALRTAPKAAHA